MFHPKNQLKIENKNFFFSSP